MGDKFFKMVSEKMALLDKIITLLTEVKQAVDLILASQQEQASIQRQMRAEQQAIRNAANTPQRTHPGHVAGLVQDTGDKPQEMSAQTNRQKAPKLPQEDQPSAGVKVAGAVKGK